MNNTRCDRLDSFMWRYSFAEGRCLIPLTEFAEAEGAKGAKTSTWFSLPGQPVFAAAGIWRDSPEWGPVYSMVMTDACPHVAGVHDRMPVLLDPDQLASWTAGPPELAHSLCRPYAGSVAARQTADLWSSKAPANSGFILAANGQ